jgi:HK97 gp10 family phage protein
MSKVNFKKEALDAIVSNIEKRFVAVGFQLETDIKRSMTTGTGRTYVKGKNRNIIHIASAPGMPPAVDTGRLRASISTNWSNSGMERGHVDGKAEAEDGVGMPKDPLRFHVYVGTNVLYAPLLEWGTRRMSARPFVRPAFDRIKGKVAQMIKSAGLRRSE